jgi:hypothetical protein
MTATMGRRKAKVLSLPTAGMLNRELPQTIVNKRKNSNFKLLIASNVFLSIAPIRLIKINLTPATLSFVLFNYSLHILAHALTLTIEF